MKWDAKLRMRQVQLRATGKKLSREEVLGCIIAEEVAIAADKVNSHFTEMEVDGGYKKREQNTSDEQMKARPSYKERKKAEKKKVNSIRRSTRAQYVMRQQLSKAGFDPNDPKTYSLLSSTPSEPNVYKETLQDIKGHCIEPGLSLVTRERVLQIGGDLSVLYRVGLRLEEIDLLRQLRNPEPTDDELFSRVLGLSDTMTEIKSNEFLLEYPSKRLVIQYVLSFQNATLLAEHLCGHFGFLERDVWRIARGLYCLAKQDLEYRLVWDVMHSGLNRPKANTEEELKEEDVERQCQELRRFFRCESLGLCSEEDKVTAKWFHEMEYNTLEQKKTQHAMLQQSASGGSCWSNRLNEIKSQEDSLEKQIQLLALIKDFVNSVEKVNLLWHIVF